MGGRLRYILPLFVCLLAFIENEYNGQLCITTLISDRDITIHLPCMRYNRSLHNLAILQYLLIGIRKYWMYKRKHLIICIENVIWGETSFATRRHLRRNIVWNQTSIRTVHLLKLRIAWYRAFIPHFFHVSHTSQISQLPFVFLRRFDPWQHKALEPSGTRNQIGTLKFHTIYTQSPLIRRRARLIFNQMNYFA